MPINGNLCQFCFSSLVTKSYTKGTAIKVFWICCLVGSLYVSVCLVKFLAFQKCQNWSGCYYALAIFVCIVLMMQNWCLCGFMYNWHIKMHVHLSTVRIRLTSEQWVKRMPTDIYVSISLEISDICDMQWLDLL